MGGVLTGAMLGHAGRDVLLLEAMDYLGGCSGTFERSGHSYNAGATTFVGLDPALPLGYLSRTLGVPLPVKSLDPSLRVHLPDRTIRLFRDRTQLMDELSRAFPEDDHQGLWRRIFRVSDAAWSMILSLPPFPPKSASELLSFLRPGSSLLMRGGPDLLRSGRSVLSRHVKTSSYRNFLDQILLITNQATSEEVPFLSGALGLSYPTLDNYTVLGGMEAALEAFARKIPSVSRKTLVQKIERVGGFFRLQTTRGAFDAQRVIVNRDVWGVADLLDDPTLDRQQEERKVRFRHRWGAVTLHFRIRDLFSGDFELHHQIHHDTNPWTGSRSFFLSLSDPEDDRLSAGGFRSVTISTHTSLSPWEGISREIYREQKEQVSRFILESLNRHLPLFRHAEKGEILTGTPRTFARYTRRTGGTVGGIPLRREFFPLGYPSALSPLPDLYLVGDSTFPGQGWPGVAVGAIGLVRRLEPGLL